MTSLYPYEHIHYYKNKKISLFKIKIRFCASRSFPDVGIFLFFFLRKKIKIEL